MKCKWHSWRQDTKGIRCLRCEHVLLTSQRIDDCATVTIIQKFTEQYLWSVYVTSGVEDIRCALLLWTMQSTLTERQDNQFYSASLVLWHLSQGVEKFLKFLFYTTKGSLCLRDANVSPHALVPLYTELYSSNLAAIKILEALDVMTCGGTIRYGLGTGMVTSDFVVQLSGISKSLAVACGYRDTDFGSPVVITQRDMKSGLQLIGAFEEAYHIAVQLPLKSFEEIWNNWYESIGDKWLRAGLPRACGLQGTNLRLDGDYICYSGEDYCFLKRSLLKGSQWPVTSGGRKLPLFRLGETIRKNVAEN